MTINLDIRKVKDRGVVCTDPNDRTKYSPVTWQLMHACHFVGIPEITEDNYYRFWVRIAAWETALGAGLVERGEDRVVDRPLTLEDVRLHIGLASNPGYEISGDEFAKKLYGMLRDRLYSKLQREEFGGDFYARQKVTYPLEQQEQHGTLDCGCPVNLVADEGHQEDCEFYEPYDDEG